MRVMSFNLRSDFILDFKNRWDNRKRKEGDRKNKTTTKKWNSNINWEWS